MPEKEKKPITKKEKNTSDEEDISPLPTITLDMLRDYLQRNTSVNKKMSIDQIAMGMSIEQRKLTGETVDPRACKVYDSAQVDPSTRKQVRRLLETYDVKYPNHLKESAEIHIVCTEKCYEDITKGKRSLPYSDHKVFYARTPLSEESVNILRDALSVFPYAELQKTVEIITALNRLTPEFNRKDFDPRKLWVNRVPRTSYYSNVSEITKALVGIVYDNENDLDLTPDEKQMSKADYEKKRSKPAKQISFEYYSYNENKELELRPLKDGTARRVANPVQLMWSNGYYYLVCAHRKKDVPADAPENEKYKFINYRVDRMKNVTCLDADADVPQDFAPAIYRSRNPVMYADSSESVIEIRCLKSLINNAIDTFGFDISIKKAEDDEESVIIRLHDTSPEGVKMWALEYGFGCEIISPPSLREDMKKSAAHLIEIYG